MSLFIDFAKTAEEISNNSSKLTKVTVLSNYLTNLDETDLAKATIWFTGSAFARKDSKKLNVGKAIIRDALIIASHLNSKEEYDKLYLEYGETGDMAEVIFKGKTVSANLDLEQIQKYFNDFVEINSTKQKSASLSTFLKKLSPLEAKYLIKIMLGDLRIGLQESLVEDAIAEVFYSGERRSEKGSPTKEYKNFANSVKWANMLMGDIGAVSKLALYNKLDEAKMNLHHPLKCMLASAEATVDDLVLRMKNKEWYADDKYDGIRAHIHKTNDKITIYSRDLNDITLVFPDINWYVSKLVGEVLLDGEIIAFKDNRIQPFFLLQKRLGRKNVDKHVLNEAPAILFIYDILYQDGEVLLDKSFEERRARIDKMEINTPGIRKSDIVLVKDPKDIMKAFKASKSRGNEGLVLKDPKSTYKPGKRGINWLKYKETLEPIDVVVTGVEFGEGRRKDELSDYTVSVWDETRRNLVTLGKVYSGANDASVTELTELFKNITIKNHGKYRDVEPRVIFEIQYESIQKSTRHKSGFALRFPRITKIRTNDKGLEDIDDMKRVEEIWKKFGGG